MTEPLGSVILVPDKKTYIMKLTKINSNSHILTTPNRNKILFSYETPVAAFVFNARTESCVPTQARWLPGDLEFEDQPRSGWVVSDRKYSRTTTKHCNAFLPDDQRNVRKVDPTFFDSLR